jgi:antirestriction protein
MRVWIGCLACYNEGNLLGEWYDVDQATDVTTKALHATGGIEVNDEGYVAGRDALYGPHEELWVFDTDETPHASLSREMSPMEAGEIAERLSDLENEGIDLEAFAAYCDHQGEEFTKADTDDFQEAYCGVWDDREDYAYNLAEDLGTVPKDHSWPASYIDWERAARDLFMDYYTADASGGQIHVFRSY